MIAERQQQEGWSAKVIPRLATDLRHEFTSLKGFSERNLGYMLRFALEYPETSILQQPVAKLPWGHNILLMEKIKDKEIRHWYMQQTVEKNWSRDLLLNVIKMDMYSQTQTQMDMYSQTQTQLKSNNFNTTLPAVK